MSVGILRAFGTAAMDFSNAISGRDLEVQADVGIKVDPVDQLPPEVVVHIF